jgi:hypothetical protein
MNFKYVAYDFAFGKHCFFCEKEFTSHKAVILRNKENKIVYSGEACAKKHAKIQLQLPDLTAIASKKEKSKRRKGVNDDLLYLFLRCDRLKDFSLKPLSKLIPLYEKLLSGEITLNDREEVFETMSSIEATFPKAGLDNLLACYGVHKILTNLTFVADSKYREFLKDIDENLRKNLSLSPKQVEGISELPSHVNDDWASVTLLSYFSFRRSHI